MDVLSVKVSLIVTRIQTVAAVHLVLLQDYEIHCDLLICLLRFI